MKENVKKRENSSASQRNWRIMEWWNKQDSWGVISYYQAFLEIPWYYYMYTLVKKMKGGDHGKIISRGTYKTNSSCISHRTG
jgi:hypothetical protein